MADLVSIDHTQLQILFDIAVGSLDFGSGFLDEEEVEALRDVALLLDVDPDKATPRNRKCKYDGKHEIVEYAWLSHPAGTFCIRCTTVLTPEQLKLLGKPATSE